MSALPAVQRCVLSLFYFEDQPVGEIARMMGIPEGTVKTHLSRSRATLRREWMRAERREGHDEL